MTLKPWHLALVALVALGELVQALDAAHNLLSLF